MAKDSRRAASASFPQERRAAMKIFVTGATGVIGRRAVPLMIEAGHRVTAAARTTDSAAAIGRAGAVPVPIDLFDRDKIHRVVAGQDAVVNLATHIPASTMRMFLPGAWRENDRLRRTASANLVNAAIVRDVGRFVQESFAPIYPDCGDAWIDEQMPMRPVRYNRTVADAEASARRFVDSGGAGVVLRFAAFYGPDAVQSRDMIAMVRRGWAPLPGAPEAFISSVSHDDAASAVVAALGAPAGIYNVADDEPLRRREFADTLAALVDVPPPKFLPWWITRLMGSMGELMARSERISARKLRDETGWKPKYPSVREGWRTTLEALRRDDALVHGGSVGTPRVR
jgi:nucleoside-diphosphate-sugar epimerase